MSEASYMGWTSAISINASDLDRRTCFQDIAVKIVREISQASAQQARVDVIESSATQIA